jgi:putative tricarboxylic transport membrane protein
MTDRVSAILLLLFSAFVIVEARTLPYWTTDAPGPGFLPFWLGVLLACGAVALFKSTAASQALPDRATAIRLTVVVALTAGASVLGLFIGLVLASGIFMGATLTYLRPGRARTNALTAVLTPVVVWLLFVRWLSVPLPTGPLGF